MTTNFLKIPIVSQSTYFLQRNPIRNIQISNANIPRKWCVSTLSFFPHSPTIITIIRMTCQYDVFSRMLHIFPRWLVAEDLDRERKNLNADESRGTKSIDRPLFPPRWIASPPSCERFRPENRWHHRDDTSTFR